MRIAIGSDHAGYRLKEHFIAVLKEGGHEVHDLGTDSEEPVDYPIYCSAVGREVAGGRAERGIVLGGSGQGEQLSANKVKGVRAEAPDVELDLVARTLELRGGVRLTRGEGWITAERASINIATAKVTMSDVKGSIPLANASGIASSPWQPPHAGTR